MSSPGGCKFNEDRSREGCYFCGKVPVRYINGPARIGLFSAKSCTALPADTLFSLSMSRDAVLCSALRTTDDNTVVHKSSLSVHKAIDWLSTGFNILHSTEYKSYFSDFNIVQEVFLRLGE